MSVFEILEEKMGQKAEYKSAKRSRKLIRIAFAKLMLEKPIDKITVTDIVKQADLNRGTFYAHYSNPYAVIEEIENEIMDNLLEFLSETNCQNFIQNPYPLLCKINHYLQEDIEYFKMLINSSSSERFINRLKKLFVSYMEKDANIAESLKGTKEFDATTYFIAGGVAELYKRWFHDELSIQSLDEMAHSASQNIIECIKKFL